MPRFNSLSPARKLRRLIVREFKEKKTRWGKGHYYDLHTGAYCAIGGALHALGIPDKDVSRGALCIPLGLSDADTWLEGGLVSQIIVANDNSKTKTEMLRRVKEICK